MKAPLHTPGLCLPTLLLAIACGGGGDTDAHASGGAPGTGGKANTGGSGGGGWAGKTGTGAATSTGGSAGAGGSPGGAGGSLGGAGGSLGGATFLVDNVPTPYPIVGSTVTAQSIAEVQNYASDMSIGEIVIANGQYDHDSHGWDITVNRGEPNRLLIRAETPGGVILDGAGDKYWLALQFRDGASWIHVDGVRFQNATPTSTGVIVTGGNGSVEPPHHITLTRFSGGGFWGNASEGLCNDHVFYGSNSSNGDAHAIYLKDWDFDGSEPGSGAGKGVCALFHWDHEPYNTHDFLAENIHGKNFAQAIVLWTPQTGPNMRIRDTLIESSSRSAVRYRPMDPSRRDSSGIAVTLERLTSTGSAVSPIQADNGQEGLQLIDCNLQ